MFLAIFAGLSEQSERAKGILLPSINCRIYHEGHEELGPMKPWAVAN